MQNRLIGPLITWTAVLLPVLLWLLFTEHTELSTRHGPTRRSAVLAGQVTGLVGMAMLAVSFILASRFRLLEDYFGGLDRMYELHHRLGVGALILIILHPVSLALRFIPEDVSRALLSFFPLHGQLAVNLGVVAFWLLVALLVITFYTRFPYHIWKVSHRFLILVLVLGAAHMLMVESTPGRNVAIEANAPLWYYMAVLTVLGVTAHAYRLIVPPAQARQQTFIVGEVERPTDRVLNVRLEPGDRALSFAPGQYVFVTFLSDDIAREAHPFTICSAPDANHLELTVKALGDFTAKLYEKLRPGTKVRVEGPYGRFDYRKGAHQQIWIAGGVGIVPFVSWMRHLATEEESAFQIALYYCVNDRQEAVHLDELREIAREMEAVSVHLVPFNEEGLLRARDIPNINNRDVFLCGPSEMISDLRRQLIRRKVPRRRIHFEAFDFR